MMMVGTNNIQVLWVLRKLVKFLWICGENCDNYQTDEPSFFRKVIVIFSVETAEVASSAMAEVLSTLCIFISDC